MLSPKDYLENEKYLHLPKNNLENEKYLHLPKNILGLLCRGGEHEYRLTKYLLSNYEQVSLFIAFVGDEFHVCSPTSN